MTNATEKQINYINDLIAKWQPALADMGTLNFPELEKWEVSELIEAMTDAAFDVEFRYFVEKYIISGKWFVRTEQQAKRLDEIANDPGFHKVGMSLLTNKQSAMKKLYDAITKPETTEPASVEPEVEATTPAEETKIAEAPRQHKTWDGEARKTALKTGKAVVEVLRGGDVENWHLVLPDQKLVEIGPNQARADGAAQQFNDHGYDAMIAWLKQTGDGCVTWSDFKAKEAVLKARQQRDAESAHRKAYRDAQVEKAHEAQSKHVDAVLEQQKKARKAHRAKTTERLTVPVAAGTRTERTTITLPGDVYDALNDASSKLGISMSEYAARAIAGELGFQDIDFPQWGGKRGKAAK